MDTITLPGSATILETEHALSLIKFIFPQNLAEKLALTKVSAPLFVKAGTGINDDLNGIEKPVHFKLKSVADQVEIVQSLAKWKRVKLYDFQIKEGEGILADMHAVRPHEEITPIHSFYVDQWDWEKRISLADRSVSYLKQTVKAIYEALLVTRDKLQEIMNLPELELPENIYFIHAEELLILYPELSAKERENEIVKQHKVVFIIGIGGDLTNNEPHDGRAPDYDDWSSENEEGYKGLNGDLVLWNPALGRAFVLSSMGIRVNKTSLAEQLQLKNLEGRRELNFHSNILNDTYPQSIGGGIGQSRLCMFLLQKRHIAEVQSSVWPEHCEKVFDDLKISAL
jgi:aspartate--ammonia ligase